MAKDGTTMPNDAGKMRTIPSVPNPGQMTENTELANKGGLGAESGAAAADNPTDMPRNPRDMANNSEVITGMGDTMPGEQGSKNLHYSGANAVAKGSDRYDKHTRSKESEYDERNVAPERELQDKDLLDQSEPTGR